MARAHSTTSLGGFRGSELDVPGGTPGDVYNYNDEVLSLIGDGKRWQIIVTIVLSLCGLCPEFNNTLAVEEFYSPHQIDYYCHHYPKYTNWTREKWMLLSHYNGTDPCRIYDLNYELVPSNFTPSVNTPTVACNSTTFLRGHGYTLTEKWNMVCHREHLIPTYKYLFFFGKVLGNVLFGIWCDRRGRRNLLILCILTQPVFGLIVASSSSYNVFVFGITFLGMFVGGAYVLSLVYAVEMMGSRACTIFTTSAFISIAASSFCLAFVQFVFHRWYHLQLFISVPVIIFLVWVRIFEESPRWLLVMLRSDDALGAMKAIAHRNRIILSSAMKLVSAPETGLVGEEDDDRDCNIWNVRHYPNLRVLVILLVFLHYGISTILQVRTLRFKILRTQLYNQAALMGCIELTSVGCTIFLLMKFGHSKVTAFSMISYGLVTLFLLIFVHSLEEEDHVMSVCLSVISYFLVIMAYVSTYVYSSRVLPTIIRGSGFGISCAAGNIGAALVTFVSGRTRIGDVKVFIISLSILSIIMALVAYVLPEAFDRELSDTLRDGEHFQRRPRPRRWISIEDSVIEDVETELAAVNLRPRYLSLES